MPWQYLPSSKMHNSLVGKSLRCARLGKYVFQIFIRHVKSQSFCHTFSTSSLMRSWSIVVASMHGPVDTFFSVSPLSYVSVCYGGCRSFHYYYHLLSAGFVDDEEVISDSKLSTNAFKDANLSSSEPSKPPNNALSASSVALFCYWHSTIIA